MFKQAKRHTPDLLKVKRTMRDFYGNLRDNSPIMRSLDTKRLVPAQRPQSPAFPKIETSPQGRKAIEVKIPHLQMQEHQESSSKTCPISPMHTTQSKWDKTKGSEKQTKRHTVMKRYQIAY